MNIWYQHFRFDLRTISICAFHIKTFKMHIFSERCEKDQMVARIKIKERKYDTRTDK